VTLEGQHLPDLLRLFALFGGAMVLLYVLKIRRRRVEVPFSPLWARVVVDRQRSALFGALKRILSLLLQLAIIALIVLALGDPKVGSFLGCTHEDAAPPPPRHTLVVIDTSASMATVEGGQTRLDEAKEKAHALLDALVVHPNQRAMVVALDATTRPLSPWTSDSKTLHDAVAAITAPTDTPTAIDAALDLARDALRGRPGAEVVLVTDRAFSPLETSKIEPLDLRVISVGATADNIGIETFNLRPLPDDALTYVAWYGVRNETDRRVNATLFLYANPRGVTEADFVRPGNLVASADLALEPQASLEGKLSDLKFEGSRVMARLVVASTDPLRDAFARDDLAFAVVPERKKRKVQLVTEGNLFLEAALIVRENLAYTRVSPAEYRGPEGFDVTLVDALTTPVDLSRAGDYLLIAPPPSADFEVSGTLIEPVVERVDKKHPLATGVTFADANILETAVYLTRKKDKVIASAQRGAPILFARNDEATRRRFVVLSFDVRASLLPMNYAFPIFLVNAIAHFSEEPEGLIAPNRAGLPVSLPLPIRASETLSLEGPVDQKSTAQSVRRLGERVHFTPTQLGIWQITATASDGTTRLPVAVNLLSPDESRIAPRGAYPAWTPPTWDAPQENPWLADFWRVLLIAALGLVTLEWLTWHRRWTV
jgi:hypothetical protein